MLAESAGAMLYVLAVETPYRPEAAPESGSASGARLGEWTENFQNPQFNYKLNRLPTRFKLWSIGR